MLHATSGQLKGTVMESLVGMVGAADIAHKLEDVMSVLNDLEEFPVGTQSSSSSSATSGPLVDMAHVLEATAEEDERKSALAAEARFQDLMDRQEALELRFSTLGKRINLLRFGHLASHIVEEVSSARDLCQRAAPPSVPAAPNINTLSLSALHPISMPEGIVLPSEPSKDVLPSPAAVASTSASATSSATVSVKEEVDCESASAGTANLQDKQSADDVLGQMEQNLKHLVQNYDSDATESSSGGESCDELEHHSANASHFVPIRRRAKWAWLSRRAEISSRWSWLTAQIADLEYRIRQQNEQYRQLRASKGPVSLGKPAVVSWPPHAKKPVLANWTSAASDELLPISCSPAVKDYSRLQDSQGRKIIIREPIASGAAATMSVDQSADAVPLPSSDPSLSSCRTRPVKPVRHRQIVCTKDLYRSSAKAAKLSTVRCNCIHPVQWCAICFGHTHHSQVPDPIAQENAQCLALLDHSYHHVLSFKEEVSLSTYLLQKIKNRSWLTDTQTSLSQALRDESAKKKAIVKKGDEEDDKNKEKLSEEEKRRRKALALRKKRQQEKERRLKRLRLKSFSDKQRRKSLSGAHGEGDAGDDAFLLDGMASPATVTSQAWADHIRRRRETAFDIDNIVIPYSIAAATRVEKLKYKEILTPSWRVVDHEQLSPAPALCEEFNCGEYDELHARAELEEQRRWQLPIWKSASGGQRGSRSSRRQDSQGSNCLTEPNSGCNSPDPMSPCMAEKVDALEVTTRPSTPVANVAVEDVAGGEASSSFVRSRRRTLSANKIRDRRPSEDMSSQCTSPSPASVPSTPLAATHVDMHVATSEAFFEVPPFEPRAFPLTDEELTVMESEMPKEYFVASSDSRSLVFSPAPFVLPSSRSSSAEEEEEMEDDNDPDWNGGDDEEDPEWRNGEEAAVGAPGHQKTSQKKSQTLQGKVPKHK